MFSSFCLQRFHPVYRSVRLFFLKLLKEHRKYENEIKRKLMNFIFISQCRLRQILNSVENYSAPVQEPLTPMTTSKKTQVPEIDAQFERL